MKLQNMLRTNIVAYLVFAAIFSISNPVFATGSNPPPVVPLPNPTLNASCGFDIALVLDSSGSINSTELGQMKDAFEGFVGAFLPATPTLFSVTDFDSSAAVVQTFTDSLSQLNIAINAPVSGGNTNWEDGLNKAFSTFDPRSDSEHPDLIVFASDGNPNRPNNTDQALQLAIVKANEIKNAGTRIIALGIGDNLNVNNLKKISSADAVYTSGFDTLATDLTNLAQELCGGTITSKKLIDVDGNLSTTEDQLPGALWSIDIDGAPSNPSAQVTGTDGFTQSIEVDSGTYSVTETQKEGFELLQAKCSVGDTEVGSPSVNGVSEISVDTNDIVSCVFINHENQAPTITLEGPNPDNLLANPGPYSDPGYSAADLEDGDLTSSVVVDGSVDTTTVGTHVITYNVTDSDGATATQKTRTVNISEPPSQCADGVDNDGDTLADFPEDPGCENEDDNDENTPPVITADALIILTLGSTFDPLNYATVNDDEDDPDPSLVVGGDTVDTNTVGDYSVTYDATDTDGAVAVQKTLTVQVRTECSDSFDNDNDTFADTSDPGCHNDADPSNPDSYDPNDNDETNPTDVCANLEGIQLTIPNGLVSQNGDCVPPTPICSDGLDNDEDQLVDALDPGCHNDNNPENPESYDPNDNDETDAEPTPTVCTDDQANNEGEPLPCTYNSNDDNGGGGGGGGGGNAICSNSRDDDGDGLVDSSDPGCHSDGNAGNPNSYVPSDNTENDGLVLGASTVAPASCFYLRDYMRIDLPNDPVEVLKLQAFLINFEGHDRVSLTGIFDQATFEAVSTFQVKYFGDILEPWGHTSSTGYVYILTLKKVNEIYCQRLFPINEAQANEIAAFKELLESLRARGINPELPFSGVSGENNSSTTSDEQVILPIVGDKDGGVKGESFNNLATAIFAAPETLMDMTKSLYGLAVLLVALYIIGNVLKDVLYKNDTVANIARKRFIAKWLVINAGLLVATVTAYFLGWWFVLPLVVALIVSLIWTSIYPEHTSIRASFKSWYLVGSAWFKSTTSSGANKEISIEPIKNDSTEKVIVMGPKK